MEFPGIQFASVICWQSELCHFCISKIYCLPGIGKPGSDRGLNQGPDHERIKDQIMDRIADRITDEITDRSQFLLLKCNLFKMFDGL